MNKLGDFFADDYEREVSLAPAMSVILPAVIVAALLGFNINALFGFAILGIEAATIILWLLANSIRDAGKALEKRLFNGVFPTTSSLRLREHSGYEVKVRRQALEELSGITLLTKRQELSDPHEADQRITGAVNKLKEQMRDPEKFKLLRRELKSYGFWRNMAAIKWWGVGVSLTSMLVSVAAFIASEPTSRVLPVMAALVAAASCLYWLLVVKDECVHKAAKRYEEQFFRSLTLLDAS